MRVEVTGRLRQDFKLEGGYEFHGIKYFGIDLDTQQEGLQGQLTMNFKIPDSQEELQRLVDVGETYVLYFDQKGKVDFVRHDDSVVGKGVK